jgi:hypothetical protein
MALDLRDVSVAGPALPEPFVKLALEAELGRLRLLRKTTGKEGEALTAAWDGLRRRLRVLGEQGGQIRVKNHVLDPLASFLGYGGAEQREAAVVTREGEEDGGWLFTGVEGARLRVFPVAAGTDLDAPKKRGHAYRYSPARIAFRVLLARGERVGLLTDGTELRLLIADPARPESHLGFRLDRGGWRGARQPPDSFRLMLALASPTGVQAMPEIVEKARLYQSGVTKDLRRQARKAVEDFIQEAMDHPENAAHLATWTDRAALARELWREGLVLIYRLLFILKLESSPDPARAFSFASTSLWRTTYSPNTALGAWAKRVVDEGADTGRLLEDGMRSLFRMFARGLSSNELAVSPLGGMLFAQQAIALLDGLRWGERAVARLLMNLLWTPGTRNAPPMRVHYGSLDVEDLGRVYEALLELEPGIAGEPMCRLLRQKMEVVVAAAQGESYRTDAAGADDDDEDGEDEETPSAGRGASIQWVEAIPPGRFYLRVGIGRKASGSYYTPHAFVRFLIDQTLGPLCEARSSKEDPHPARLLELNVLDPAMGSGHFLVEACRFLGDKLYEACRLCDDRAVELEAEAEKSKDAGRSGALRTEAALLRKRVEDLPDPNDELLYYLPSRAPEGEDSGISQKKAEAMCRRLVAVHCLYGVDKNPLAVELAKLTLWLESFAEGLPLTFLDHRLVCGDSLTGPMFADLLTYPGTGGSLDDLASQGLASRLQERLAAALTHVDELEATVGKDLADIQWKEQAKARLDAALEPLPRLASVWAGGVMLGAEGGCDDAAYAALAKCIVEDGDWQRLIDGSPSLKRMHERGGMAFSYDLGFPEVFRRSAGKGFDVVVGNPPWEGIDTSTREFFGGLDVRVFDLRTEQELNEVVGALRQRPGIAEAHAAYVQNIVGLKRAIARLYRSTNQAGDQDSAATPDLYQPFLERAVVLAARPDGEVGLCLPGSLHANEGAAGLRRLLIDDESLSFLYSFENRQKLFEIDSRYKIDLVGVTRRPPSATHDFGVGFYLHDPAWLFERRLDEELRYTRRFLERTTGELLNFLELRAREAVPLAETMYGARVDDFGTLRARLKVRPTEELHKSKNRWRLLPRSEVVGIDGDIRSAGWPALLSRNMLPFAEGKTFHQYTDTWGDEPEFVVPLDRMTGKEARLRAARYFRLAFRTIASSTNERSAIFTLLPPGQLCSNSALPEAEPWLRPNRDALLIIALANTFCFDWLLRLAVSANITFNFLDSVPVPRLSAAKFLVHSAARLVSNHSGFQSLWTEQLGNSTSLPAVIGGDRARLRAAVDAVVARDYGLSRDQFAAVLRGFSHATAPDAPELCLRMFDELAASDLDAWCRRYDPFADRPLCDDPPTSVAEFSASSSERGDRQPSMFGAETTGRRTPSTSRRRRTT